VLRYVMKRLGAGVVLMFVVSLVAFTLLIVGSGNVGRSALGVNATKETVEEFNKAIGVDRPLLVQYVDWLSHAVRGDLGNTWESRGQVSVWSGMRVTSTITVTIVALSVIVAVMVATLLGVLAATRGKTVDRGVQLIGLIGFAIPGYLIAMALVTFFAVKWHFFRATGYTGPTESFTQWLKSVTLPVISLALGTIASLSLQIRGAVRDALSSDFVRTLRSRGLSGRRTTVKHVLRNVAGPSLSLVGLQFIGLLGGAVIVENVFAIPGMGRRAVLSAGQGDVTVVMGIVLVTALLVIFVNLIIDLLTAWLNPKVRLT
jgi:peptide/nickel transport system permease protein